MASEQPARTGHQTGIHDGDARDGDAHGWDEELVPDARGRTRRPEADCPVETALAAVSGRWTTLVLRELMGGPRGFTELRTLLPELSAKVLSERLTALRERGLVTAERLRGFPVRTRYELTEAGRSLRPLLIALYATGAELQRLTTGQGTGERQDGRTTGPALSPRGPRLGRLGP